MAITVQTFMQTIEQRAELQQEFADLLEHIQQYLSQHPHMTYEEFLAWTDEDTLAEWVNGDVVMASPASDRHQDIVRFLTSVLSIYVETHQLGIIRPAPFQMKLTHSGREPDVLFVANDHLDRVRPTYLDGPADLVIEVISLESVERDRGTKFLEYEADGVPEYWVIDPLRNWAEFYHLSEIGRYNIAFAGHEQVYHAIKIPGFWLQVEWLWQTPLPQVLDVVRELQVI
jgi:Uma2 family endonuclease